MQKFRRGVVIDGRKTKPAKIQILEREKDGRFCTAEIVIHEGRNRQVRKMCEYHILLHSCKEWQQGN